MRQWGCLTSDATSLGNGSIAAATQVLICMLQVGAVYRAMGLLTTASPCALVLVPMAYVAAIASISFRCCTANQLPASA